MLRREKLEIWAILGIRWNFLSQTFSTNSSADHTPLSLCWPISAVSTMDSFYLHHLSWLFIVSRCFRAPSQSSFLCDKDHQQSRWAVFTIWTNVWNKDWTTSWALMTSESLLALLSGHHCLTRLAISSLCARFAFRAVFSGREMTDINLSETKHRSNTRLPVISRAWLMWC